ncbi:MAG TPA: BamA/TamA family outer membrane protein [Vicinamibacterales bacterium]|nr:BamA/TamA family outer membrane protein [Vicinamibacterales bacterium]
MMPVSMRALVFVLSVLIGAAPAAAQATRVEAIAEQQAEKAKALGVEGPSQAERVIRRVLLSPLLSGGDGFYPWFGSVFSGTGMAIGAGYLKRFANAAGLNLQSGISLNNSMMVRGTVAAPQLFDLVQLDATAQWLDARGVSYYGSGPDSEQSARTRYDFEPIEIGVNATARPFRYVFIGAGYSLLDINTTIDVPRFRPAEMPGIDRDLTFQVARATVALDTRPAPGYSTRGGLYRVTIERHHESGHRPFSFQSAEYEAVQMLPLVREQFVLAGRALMTIATPDTGHEVPVVLAPFLGSGSTLRGFANRRFSDRNRVLLTGEYRWRPSRYLDMALFLDAGQVAPNRQDFDISEFETSWGVGARFHGPNFNALRIEVARSREGLRIIFGGSQAF